MGALTRRLAGGVQGRAIQVITEEGLISEDGGYETLGGIFGGTGTIAGPRMNPESAQRMMAVNACVRLKVNAARSIPMHVYAEGEDGFKDYAAGRASRYFALVHDEPNPEQPADEFWAQIAGFQSLRCNAFLWKERFPTGPRAGLVRHLWAIDPRRMTVRRKNGVKIYELAPDIHGGGERTTLDPADVIHIKSGQISSDGLVGVSAISQCREELATHAGVREYLAHHIGRGANFPGYLYTEPIQTKDGLVPVEIDKDERERIEEKLISPGRGVRGVKHVPVFNAALRWQQIGMTLADQEFMDLMGFGVADVAMLMGVPPTLINAPVRSSSLTYRTTAEEDLRFLKYGIGSELTAIESALGHDPDLFAGSGYTPEYRREAHLAMDTIARYTAHALAIRAGWKAPNEVRRAENLEEIEGGDTLLRPGQQPDKETRELLAELESFMGRHNGGQPALN